MLTQTQLCFRLEIDKGKFFLETFPCVRSILFALFWLQLPQCIPGKPNYVNGEFNIL